MKRRVLCIVCLVVFILSACTLFSLKIEKEMLIQAEVKKVRGIGTWDQTVILPQTVLFEDTYGSHLYQVVEGIGWESGLRVEEMRKDDYKIDVEKGTVSLPGGSDYCFITTASRQPVPGELVEIIEAKEIVPSEDSFLFVYPLGIPESYSTTSGIAVAAQSKVAVHGINQTAAEPFFEHKEKGNHQTMTGANWRIFSKNTVVSFWKQIPLLLILALLVLSVMLLWGFSFLVCMHAYPPKRVFIFSGAVSIGALIAIVVILSLIDLPSAMLPASNILHLHHYSNEYDIMLSGLNSLPAADQAFLVIKESVEQSCILNTVIAVVLTVITMVVEWLFIRKE